MGFYSVATLLEDARRHGIRARPVSVLHSQAETTVLDDHHLRLGLHRLKGLRQDHHRPPPRGPLPTAASPPSPTSSAASDPNKKERRLLAAAGALNDLPEITHRRARPLARRTRPSTTTCSGIRNQ